MSLFLAMSLAKPKFVELIDALSEARANWYDLGLRLDISDGTLDAIKANHDKVEDCLRKMLQQWLQTYPEREWSAIVTALIAIHRNDVAGEVDIKYCKRTAGLLSSGIS